MDTKLYVGNLAYSTTEVELQQLFAQAGTVKSAQVIKDRDTGRSKGFAFIEMENQAEAQKAIAMFHGKLLSDRELTVNIARPLEDRPRPSGGAFNKRGGGNDRGGGRDKRSQRGGNKQRRY